MTGKTLASALIGSLVAIAATATALPTRRPSTNVPVVVERPRTPRVRIQVLNATKTRGLGRRAMLYLRDQGFDVVEMGTTSATRDTTLVLDRSRHPDWARSVASSLGTARVES